MIEVVSSGGQVSILSAVTQHSLASDRVDRAGLMCPLFIRNVIIIILARSPIESK